MSIQFSEDIILAKVAAIHNYRDVDLAIVTGIVHDHLDDLERFAVRVLEATVNRG